MIKILDFNKELQNDTKSFVIENMNRELDIKDKNAFLTITKDLDNIEENYINKGGRFLIAYDYSERRIVGTIAFTFENGMAILKRFYVSEKVRKQRIGFLLYKTLEEIIKINNIKNIYLVSGKELECAQAFYKKNGWKETLDNPGLFVRKGAVLYQKEIKEDL